MDRRRSDRGDLAADPRQSDVVGQGTGCPIDGYDDFGQPGKLSLAAASVRLTRS
ncbi:MAG: hypothetical protein Q7S35_13145 [Candidatus Limnocylindrales bacterium]|nr:hypothetical protein [Candidatus Limnocylindrales bacterium]